jgi:alkylation response protein AidB-like acyl-CoA dehydrogenase
MTTVDRLGTTAQGVLDAVRGLAPTIAGRAAEIESGRRVPRDLLDELIAAGCFRLLLPRSHAGLGADLPAAMRVIEALSRADASVGWTVMIGGGSWVDVCGLPRGSFDRLFAAPDVIVAGAINPSGSITAVPGGYRVSGRWSFASGCEHAAWLYGNCIEAGPDGDAGGAPRMRIAVFAPEEVAIEDTWNVSGLRGTGSHHFRVSDLVVPADRTLNPLADHACVDEPIVRIPVPALLALQVAGVAIGAAHGAIDDILDIAANKVPLLAGATLAANPLFQVELATADTDLHAARALLYQAAESAWATAAAGEPFTLPQRARLRAAAVWATARAVDVVETAYRAGGGSSLYADCPLQRRLRDVHAVTQHFLVKRDTLTTAGAILAGQDVDPPIF